mmetsp:Transcript_108225/g.304989  ORF Transcript_108225/g.304989 Transcript_108225/m.304989 type:complete len:310 (-) Transcript_108225:470-1399(-)
MARGVPRAERVTGEGRERVGVVPGFRGALVHLSLCRVHLFFAVSATRREPQVVVPPALDDELRSACIVTHVPVHLELFGAEPAAGAVLQDTAVPRARVLHDHAAVNVDPHVPQDYVVYCEVRRAQGKLFACALEPDPRVVYVAHLHRIAPEHRFGRARDVVLPQVAFRVCARDRRMVAHLLRQEPDTLQRQLVSLSQYRVEGLVRAPLQGAVHRGAKSGHPRQPFRGVRDLRSAVQQRGVLHALAQALQHGKRLKERHGQRSEAKDVHAHEALQLAEERLCRHGGTALLDFALNVLVPRRNLGTRSRLI